MRTPRTSALIMGWLDSLYNGIFNNDSDYSGDRYHHEPDYDNIHCIAQGYYRSSSGGIHWGKVELDLDRETYNRCHYNPSAIFNIVRLHYPDAIAIEDGFTMLYPE